MSASAREQLGVTGVVSWVARRAFKVGLPGTVSEPCGSRTRHAAKTAMFVMVAGVLASLSARAQAPDSDSVTDLRLIELPAPTGRTLAVVLTGDGGWSQLERQVASEFVANGVSVIGLESCEYLSRDRSPDKIAVAVSRVMRHYMTAWKRDRVLLLGYSRGADLAPFVVNRLGASLQSRLVLVAMLGLADQAGFECRFIDLFRDTRRTADQPTVSELERIHDVPLLCVYGTDERRSPCRRGEVPAMERLDRSGGHHFDGDYRGIARDILKRLPVGPV